MEKAIKSVLLLICRFGAFFVRFRASVFFWTQNHAIIKKHEIDNDLDASAILQYRKLELKSPNFYERNKNYNEEENFNRSALRGGSLVSNSVQRIAKQRDTEQHSK
ncbi:MAG: hypothetical protein K2N56_12440 [Oscillospiraceae bacterium]|nr:hypothetical protein [Oscillospiraceae bacterium]